MTREEVYNTIKGSKIYKEITRPSNTFNAFEFISNGVEHFLVLREDYIEYKIYGNNVIADYLNSSFDKLSVDASNRCLIGEFDFKAFI